MAFDFTGKRMLVTGAGSGVGKALALALVNAGAEVYGLSKQSAHLDALVKLNPKIHPIQVDLSDWDATRAALEHLEPMDGLVNNAAIVCAWTPSLTVSKDILDEIFAVNVYGAVNVTQVIGAKMVESGKGGSIVNVSSVNGVNPMRELMPYNMSKAALDMMTKQFALELGPHKIRVNSVNPTSILTDLGKQYLMDSDVGNKIRSHMPLGRFCEISDVVQPIMYLLSDHSSMVTGTMHGVDGGLFCNISV